MSDLPSLAGYKLQTRYGFFDFENPYNIDLRDVEHSLRNKVRFNGHAIDPFTVLQHTILVHDIAVLNNEDDVDAKTLTKIRLACLLHDAPEYVVGDMASPLKAYIKEFYGFDINVIEDKILQSIYMNLGLTWSDYTDVLKYIKNADFIALATEKAYGFDVEDQYGEVNEYEWTNLPEPVDKDMFNDSRDSMLNDTGEYVNLVLRLASRLRAW